MFIMSTLQLYLIARPNSEIIKRHFYWNSIGICSEREPSPTLSFRELTDCIDRFVASFVVWQDISTKRGWAHPTKYILVSVCVCLCVYETEFQSITTSHRWFIAVSLSVCLSPNFITSICCVTVQCTTSCKLATSCTTNPQNLDAQPFTTCYWITCLIMS